MGKVGKNQCFFRKLIEITCSTRLPYIDNMSWFSGNAVTANLLDKGYNVTSLMDIDASKCDQFPQCLTIDSPRELAEKCDIIISGS